MSFHSWNSSRFSTLVTVNSHIFTCLVGSERLAISEWHVVCMMWSENFCCFLRSTLNYQSKDEESRPTFIWVLYWVFSLALRKWIVFFQGWYLLDFIASSITPTISPGPAVRVFANGPGILGSIPGRVIPKTLKMVLDTTLLNTQHYKVRFKGKVEQSWEWSSALLYTLV